MAESKIHIVQKNDTVSEIAQEFGLEWKRLWDFNTELKRKRKMPERIQPGDKLKIPPNEEKFESAGEDSKFEADLAESYFSLALNGPNGQPLDDTQCSLIFGFGEAGELKSGPELDEEGQEKAKIQLDGQGQLLHDVSKEKLIVPSGRPSRCSVVLTAPKTHETQGIVSCEFSTIRKGTPEHRQQCLKELGYQIPDEEFGGIGKVTKQRFKEFEFDCGKPESELEQVHEQILKFEKSEFRISKFEKNTIRLLEQVYVNCGAWQNGRTDFAIIYKNEITCGTWASFAGEETESCGGVDCQMMTALRYTGRTKKDLIQQRSEKFFPKMSSTMKAFFEHDSRSFPLVYYKSQHPKIQFTSEEEGPKVFIGDTHIHLLKEWACDNFVYFENGARTSLASEFANFIQHISAKGASKENIIQIGDFFEVWEVQAIFETGFEVLCAKLLEREIENRVRRRYSKAVAEITEDIGYDMFFDEAAQEKTAEKLQKEYGTFAAELNSRRELVLGIQIPKFKDKPDAPGQKALEKFVSKISSRMGFEKQLNQAYENWRCDLKLQDVLSIVDYAYSIDDSLKGLSNFTVPSIHWLSYRDVERAIFEVYEEEFGGKGFLDKFSRIRGNHDSKEPNVYLQSRFAKYSTLEDRYANCRHKTIRAAETAWLGKKLWNVVCQADSFPPVSLICHSKDGAYLRSSQAMRQEKIVWEHGHQLDSANQDDFYWKPYAGYQNCRKALLEYELSLNEMPKSVAKQVNATLKEKSIERALALFRNSDEVYVVVHGHTHQPTIGIQEINQQLRFERIGHYAAIPSWVPAKPQSVSLRNEKASHVFEQLIQIRNSRKYSASTKSGAEKRKHLNETLEGLNNFESIRLTYCLIALRKAGIELENWTPETGFKPNKKNVNKVYDYYKNLYFRDGKRRFIWSGFARLAGAEVVKGLEEASDPKALKETYEKEFPNLSKIPRVDDLVVENRSRKLVKILIQMQKEIFLDLAWQHELFLALGYKGIELSGQLDELNQTDMAAWKDIANGKKSLVHQANERLLRREQKLVLDKYYSEIRSLADFDMLPRQMSKKARSAIPGGKSFREVVPDGDITMFEPRWKWITKMYYNELLMIPKSEFEKLIKISTKALIKKKDSLR